MPDLGALLVLLILVIEPVEVVARVVRRELAWTEPVLQRTGTR